MQREIREKRRREKGNDRRQIREDMPENEAIEDGKCGEGRESIREREGR